MIDQNYNIEMYKQDLKTYGLEQTWNNILEYVLNNGETEFLNTKDFGELYEIGLAETNVILKKEFGKYYTPTDVARLMAEYLIDIPCSDVCDVCCGTGNLILAYLAAIPRQEAIELIKRGKIHLYDCDPVALTICVYSIAILYGDNALTDVDCVCGDFLAAEVKLPNRCKVISNPPYAKYSKAGPDWDKTLLAISSKDLYAVIMETISFLPGSICFLHLSIITRIAGEKIRTGRCLRESQRSFRGISGRWMV